MSTVLGTRVYLKDVGILVDSEIWLSELRVLMYSRPVGLVKGWAPLP